MNSNLSTQQEEKILVQRFRKINDMGLELMSVNYIGGEKNEYK